ncbi:MAG: hypothetical protein ABI904_15120 [Chloroflexota bacterium]
MNEHAEILQMILKKDTLTPSEVKEGVVTCFLAINRDFVKRRLGEVPAEQVDATLKELVMTVFEEHQIDPENPSLPMLKRAELVLEEQAGFESEPDLLKMHKSVIDTLFSRVQK